MENNKKKNTGCRWIHAVFCSVTGRWWQKKWNKYINNKWNISWQNLLISMTCGFHGAAACRACLLHWGTKMHKHTRCRTGICRFCGSGQQSSLQGVKWRTENEGERERERDRVWLRVKATKMPSQPQAISCWGYYWSFQGALWTCSKGNPMCHLRWKIWWTQWETDQHKRHFCTAKV